MFVLLTLLSVTATPADSFRVKVTAPADVALTITYQVDKQQPVLRRVKGSTAFRIPSGNAHLTVGADRPGGKAFNVEIRSPGDRIVGDGNGDCAVEIKANRNSVDVKVDPQHACKRQSNTTRTSRGR